MSGSDTVDCPVAGHHPDIITFRSSTFSILGIMSSLTLLVFNGLHLPVDAIDTAIAWTQKTNGKLTVLFIVSEKDQDGGYPFPNDLELTEEPEAGSESIGDDLAIIASTIRLARRQAAFAQIELQTTILPAPKKEKLQQLFESADQIFVTENTLDPAVLSIDPDRIAAALQGLSAITDWIS